MDAYEGWAILELFGHRRLAGQIREAEIGGGKFIRIDVPGDDGRTVATQFYGAAAIYCVTPTTEEIARAVAKRSQPEPATAWELRPAIPARVESREPGDDLDDELD